MGATCTLQTYKNFCKFFSESDKKNSGEQSRAILALLSLKFWLAITWTRGRHVGHVTGATGYFCVEILLYPFLHIYTHFNTVKKYFKKILWKKVKLLNMSKFTFFHNVFYAICIFKSFHSHISVVVCSFFEFGAISKWYIQKWINVMSRSKQKASQIQIFPVEYACFQLLGR